MSSAQDLAWMDATAQAQLVAAGQLSARELVDAAIDHVEQLNGELNAVIHERFERAREEAVRPLPAGPFQGVPMVLKDLGCRSAGDPYHAGMRFLRRLGWRSDHDSYLTARFRAAGFLILGRSNTPELAMSMTTEPEAYGSTRNPWNLERSAGGSSGGSAAAVASGMVAVAHASDGGGSIRIPASACGLVGLKPTRGRVSQGPDVGQAWAGALIDHVLTRTVRDSAAILDAVAGYVPGDPYAAPVPQRPFAAEAGEDPPRLRIGLLDSPLADSVTADPDCAAAVVGAGRLLEALGHDVVLAHPPSLEPCGFGEHFNRVLAVCGAAEVASIEAMTGTSVPRGELEEGTLALITRGRAVSGVDYVTSVTWLERFARRVTDWWSKDRFDVLVTPVLNGPPPPLGWFTAASLRAERVEQLLQYLRQFNVTGQPAISLPLHWTPDGLPIGVQLVGAYGREDILIRLASQLEQAAPWATRRPPIGI